MNIILTGFKAAGKSTAGKALAALTGLRFEDTDTLVEELYARHYSPPLSCREIYRARGEETLRTLESLVLRQVAGEDGLVLATGGGIVLEKANRTLLRRAGITVFLDTPLPVLEERLARHPDSPLFAACGVAALHARRYPVYCDTADIHLVTEPGETPSDVARRIRKAVEETPHG